MRIIELLPTKIRIVKKANPIIVELFNDDTPILDAEFELVNNEAQLISLKRKDSINAPTIDELFKIANRHWGLYSHKNYFGVLLGDGPFERDEYLAKLKNKNVSLNYSANQAEQIIILGTNLTNVDFDKWHPYWGKARIFSQQSFLDYSSGCLNTEEDNENVSSLLKLSKFCNGYFQWPSTEILPSRNVLAGINADEIGILSIFGYHVGKNSNLSHTQRQQILRTVFSAEIIFEGIDREWGVANTPDRLLKMANCIATFTRTQKRKNPSRKSEIAISEWEIDLEWLKINYYDKLGFDGKFTWPNTNERHRYGY